MQLPDPAGMELQEWADATTYITSQYANIPFLSGPDWQAWGVSFFNSPQLGNIHPADPYGFSDWRDWGRCLGQSLLNARGSQSRALA
jgi:hypothetical protein